MTRIAELLQSPANPIEQRSIIRGYISTNRPAPTAFTQEGSTENWLWVIVPEYSTERPFGPCKWTAEHGITLPSQGAEVMLAFDESNFPTVIWWEGETVFAADERSLAVAGTVTSEEFPGFYIHEAKTLLAAEYRLLSGTSVSVEVMKNKSGITGYTALTAVSTGGTTTSSEVALSSGDYINWKTSSPLGTPKGLSVTLFLRPV